ncbi:MAG: DNA cytosine methyltransferase [Candidatus Pacearchaeota archaeon]|jgi:DNA (cytosine-5)-methyltransferase 1
MTLKILNLYAGIGGNRKLWNGDIEVTAIENNKAIAELYKQFYPGDKVIIADAHQYLLEHYKEFDFIWSSPPCPSHSRARFWGSFGKGRTIIYPDMRLYQEIIFLTHYCKNIKWVVENVKPYYKPLIEAQQLGRHLFWSNFIIPGFKSETLFFPKDSLPTLQKIYGIELGKLNVDIDKRVILRNMVNPELGLHIIKQIEVPKKAEENCEICKDYPKEYWCGKEENKKEKKE